MTLKELAAQYRKDAKIIEERIEERKKKLKRLNHSQLSPYRMGLQCQLEREIIILEDMYREAVITADKLEHYYEK